MRLLKILLVGLLFTNLAFALSKDEINSSFTAKINEAMEILQNKSINKQQKASKIFTLFDKNFDYKQMAKISLSSYYQTLTPEQINKFNKAYEQKLKDSFISKLEIYTNEVIKIVGVENVNPKRVLLKTLIMGAEKNYPIDFKFYPKDSDNWMIYDVDVLGVSIVATYRSQFSSLSKTANFDEILSKLQTTEAITQN